MTTFIFRKLPGVAALETDQMIADKFHQAISTEQVDEVSRSLFGVTASELQIGLPPWFRKGFDSAQEWDDAMKTSRPDDWEDVEWMVGSEEELELETPERQLVYNQVIAFVGKMQVPETVNDDYSRMDFAKTFGFDFSDETGKHPLRVTKLFFRQALAAARGVTGHLPDLGELGTQAWGSKLEEEARRFARKR